MLPRGSCLFNISDVKQLQGIINSKSISKSGSEVQGHVTRIELVKELGLRVLDSRTLKFQDDKWDEEENGVKSRADILNACIPVEALNLGFTLKSSKELRQ